MKRATDIAALIWEIGEPQMPQDLASEADKKVSTLNAQLWRNSAPQADAPLFRQVYNGAYMPMAHPETGEPLTVLLVTEAERQRILDERASTPSKG